MPRPMCPMPMKPMLRFIGSFLLAMSHVSIPVQHALDMPAALYPARTACALALVFLWLPIPHNLLYLALRLGTPRVRIDNGGIRAVDYDRWRDAMGTMALFAEHIRPYRLEAQDITLSRWKHGFESRWGYHMRKATVW